VSLSVESLPTDVTVTSVDWIEVREAGASTLLATTSPTESLTWVPFPPGTEGEVAISAAIHVQNVDGETVLDAGRHCYAGGARASLEGWIEGWIGGTDRTTSVNLPPSDQCPLLAWRLGPESGAGADSTVPGVGRVVVEHAGAVVSSTVYGPGSAWWSVRSGNVTPRCDLTRYGTYDYTLTVTTRTGFEYSTVLTANVVPGIEVVGPRLRDASGRAITPSTWVLSGSTVRYDATFSTRLASNGITQWSVDGLNGNGQTMIAGYNNASDRAKYPCLGTGQQCGSTVTIDRTFRANRYKSDSYTVRTYASSEWGRDNEHETTASFRIYQRGSLSAPASRTIDRGTSTTLVSRLTKTIDYAGQPVRGVSGEKVVLQSRPKGATTWKPVRTLTTDAQGSVRTTVKPSVNAQYRFVHADHKGVVGPATSATTLVLVRAKASVTVTTARPDHRRMTTFRVTTSPKDPGATVTIQRQYGSGWRTVATGKTSSAGTATLSGKLPAGQVNVRVMKSITDRYATVFSPKQRLTVR